MKTFWLIFYYGFARFLPGSHTFWGHVTCAERIRYLCGKHLFKSIGKNVNIEHRAWFGKGYDIEIGDNSGIGYNAHILFNTKIGRDVMMGPNLFMLEKTHRFDRIDIPMIQQGRHSERNQVIIEDDCWIGQDVMIIGSQTIHEGSIVGARCVLTKSFPEYSVIGGNPSRLLKIRS